MKALYPGSFDPFTWGHQDIIERALKLFEEVHIVVSQSPQKNYLFSAEERVSLIQASLSNCERVVVSAWDGLIMDYARERNLQALVRGLRVASDFEYEFMMTTMNRELNPDVETVFLCTRKDLIFVSSSIIKEVAHYGGSVSKYIPPCVEKALLEKLKR